jgi:hypothetical protein
MNEGNVVSDQDAKTMGMALLNALREDQIGKVKLGYEGFAGDCIEVVRIKRFKAPVLLYSVEGEAEDVGFRVTITKILPDPFMLEPLREERKKWTKKFAHFLILQRVRAAMIIHTTVRSENV